MSNFQYGLYELRKFGEANEKVVSLQQLAKGRRYELVSEDMGAIYTKDGELPGWDVYKWSDMTWKHIVKVGEVL